MVPEVARAAAPELDELRAACRGAIRRVASGTAPFVVLGAGARWAFHRSNARGSLAGYGVPLEVPLGVDEPGPVELPLSLTIGAWLLRDALGPGCAAVGYSVGPDGVGQPDRLPPPPDGGSAWNLLVMGDGSARRGTSAPGYLDERARPFDDRIADALRRGRPDLLRHRSRPGQPGDSLMVAGRSAWAVAAGFLDSPGFDAELLYDDAPYGVGYFVAAWTRRG
jgi:hypothetical protein